MQVRQRTRTRRLRCDEIEVFVVPFDPIERRAWTRVGPIFVREIARTDPERDFGVARHYAIQRIEVAVQITDRAEEHTGWFAVYRLRYAVHRSTLNRQQRTETVNGER